MAKGKEGAWARFLAAGGLVRNKYVGPPYCRAEMYAGRVTCCPLVSHGEYATSIELICQTLSRWAELMMEMELL